MIPFGCDITGIIRSLWNLLTELPFAVTYDRGRKNVHNRSIVRAIGSILPLPPAPRVVFNLAAWSPDVEIFTDDTGCDVVSPKAEPKDSHHYQRQIDELQEELKTIKNKLAVLLERETSIKLERFAASKNEMEVINEKGSMINTIFAPPPPPPPPPPMPDLTLVTSKPPIVRKPRRNVPRYGAQANTDALHLVISQLAKEKPKLRHVERSPGGRPIKPKKEPELDANDILAQVLKKRYSALQESSDAESFNASFTDITSPIKSTLC